MVHVKCLLKTCLLLWTCLNFSPIQAQFIVPGELIQESLPTFNEDSIAKRGIRSITLRTLRKPSMKPIYDDGKRTRYRFNEKGQVTEFKKIYPGKYGVLDTSIVRCEFEQHGPVRLLERVVSYRRLTSYSYPEDDVVHLEIKVKRGNSPWQVIRREELVTQEDHNSRGMNKRITRGGIGEKAYQKTDEHYDGFGRITSREIWNGNRSQSIETWVWQDDKIKGYFKNDLLENRQSSIEYNIDAPRQEEGKWCIEECREWSIVHHKNGLPKGWIFMNPKTENMEIWEFDYDFFDTANR